MVYLPPKTFQQKTTFPENKCFLVVFQVQRGFLEVAFGWPFVANEVSFCGPRLGHLERLYGLKWSFVVKRDAGRLVRIVV
jgi:hypothetical protein